MSHSSSIGLLWLSSSNDRSSIGLPWLSFFNDGVFHDLFYEGEDGWASVVN